MLKREHRTWALQRHALGAGLALLLGVPSVLAGEEANQASNEASNSALAMPESVSDTPFASEREAVMWRQQELKDIESLVRQLRFDLVNNQDVEAAAPRLAELQERARGQQLLPAFIKGTHGSGSDARSTLWEEWDEFATGFTDLEAKIDQLVEVAEQGNVRQTAQALSEVGASCKSCHRAYRYD
jgi:cytochrome c556